MNKTVIPLSASSRLTNVTGVEPLEINPYANRTDTAEAAPVLLSINSIETYDADRIATAAYEMAKQGTAAQARLNVNAFAAVLQDLVAEYGAISVQTPLGVFSTQIAGSIENSNDPIDPWVNYAYLGVTVPEVYRREIAGIDTFIPAAACPVSLKRIRDKATGEANIHGTDAFYLEGRGMTIGGAGERLELLDPLTRAKVCDVGVDAATKSLSNFVCTLDPAGDIEAGEYLLQLTTAAGGGEGATLWPVDLKVVLATAIHIPVPTLTNIKGSPHSEDDWSVNCEDTKVDILGSNLKLDGDGAKIRLSCAGGTPEYVDITGDELSLNDDDHLQVNGVEKFSEWAPGSDLTLTVMNSKGSVSHAYAFTGV